MMFRGTHFICAISAGINPAACCAVVTLLVVLAVGAEAHPPFRIDGNLGGTSGMAEMLLQGHAGRRRAARGNVGICRVPRRLLPGHALLSPRREESPLALCGGWEHGDYNC